MAILTFPTLIGATYPVDFTIATQTIRNIAVSGKTATLLEWTYPIYKVGIPVSYLGSNPAGANQDWQALTGFFKRVGGPTIPFHWNNPDDNAIAGQNIGTGDGSTTIFGFSRTLGGFAEPVQDVSAVSSVTVGGTPTTNYTLLQDPNWGFVYGLQFGSAPGNGAAVAASFTYDWPCEFPDDTLALSKFAYQFWEAKKITFQTKKVM